MTNEAAVELLDNFTETASRAVMAAVWANAFLQYGGEATWDAVKSVSDIASLLLEQCAKVEELREQYEEIVPF